MRNDGMNRYSDILRRCMNEMWSDICDGESEGMWQETITSF